MATVFLFDIDGTLLDARGAGRRAMQAAFERVCPGRAEAMAQVRFAGMTDPGIARAALRNAGEPADDAQIEQLLRAYLTRIEAELATETPTVLSGALRSVEVALAQPAAVVGLGTGNHVDGARAKLSSVGLWERFGFGGFGSDAEDRAEMLAVGRARGLEQLGVVPSEARVVVIGDTPRDVAAAHAIGASCLAVTTGPHDAQVLKDAGADRVVDRLDRDEALAFLVG